LTSVVCEVCNEQFVFMPLYDKKVCRKCWEFMIAENERNQNVGYAA
jgi:hypothetical protein